MIKRGLISVLSALTLVAGACGDPDDAAPATPAAPPDTTTAVTEPTSTEPATTTTAALDVEPPVLTFDGESCVHQGPADVPPGPTEFVFVNDSDGYALVNMIRHPPDRSVQDMIDYLGRSPSTKHAPSWAGNMGPWNRHSVPAGGTGTWEYGFQEGIHTMVCGTLGPFEVWFGGALTVTA